MSMIQIEPVMVGFNQTANGVKLIQGSYVLGTNEDCKCRVEFYQNTDIKCEQKVIIPSTLVRKWGEDDTEIIDYVLDELGLIRDVINILMP